MCLRNLTDKLAWLAKIGRCKKEIISTCTCKLQIDIMILSELSHESFLHFLRPGSKLVQRLGRAMSVVHVWGCDCVSISRGRWVCFLVARRPQCPHTWPLRSTPCSAHCTRCTRFSRFQVTWRGREGRDHPMCAAAQSPYTPVLPPCYCSTPPAHIPSSQRCTIQ